MEMSAVSDSWGSDPALTVCWGMCQCPVNSELIEKLDKGVLFLASMFMGYSATYLSL